MKLTLWQQLTQFAHVLQVESLSDPGGGGRPAGRTRQAVGGHFGNDSPGALRPQFQRVDRPSELGLLRRPMRVWGQSRVRVYDPIAALHCFLAG